MTGLGAMMAGGNPAEGRIAEDLYETPEIGTIALLGAETFTQEIHEGCCGNGKMARILEQAGYTVIGTDVNSRSYGTRRDIFDTRTRLAPCFVTNPPFGKLAEPIIRHVVQVLRPIKAAFLLKAHFFHADERRAMFKEMPPARIHPLSFRLDFLNKGRPTMECSWYVWDSQHSGPTVYCDPIAKPADAKCIPRVTCYI